MAPVAAAAAGASGGVTPLAGRQGAAVSHRDGELFHERLGDQLSPREVRAVARRNGRIEPFRKSGSGAPGRARAIK